MAKVLFQADDGNGSELWITDGTSVGTQLLRVINPYVDGSNPNGFTKLSNGKVLFQASSGTNNAELWITDGTTAGTTLVKEIRAGLTSAGSNPNGFTELNNGQVLFQASSSYDDAELWITDGTSVGTQLLRVINPYVEGSNPNGFTELSNGKVLFQASSGHNNAELWITDGTTAGTTLVKEIRAGLTSAGSNPNGFTELNNGKVLFQADDGINGTELWVTDGTSVGTQLLRVINPYVDGSNPNGFTKLSNGKVLFQASSGTNNAELWITDGTTAGTTLVKEIRAGLTSAGSNPNGFIELNNGQVLFQADDGINGTELWITDGTSVGTTLLRVINPYVEGSNPNGFTKLSNGKVLFQASSGHNNAELWITDGTTAGTTLVKEIRAGLTSAGSNPNGFTELSNGQVLFQADDGINGNELWITDGTSVGTTLLKHINNVPSNPDYPELSMGSNPANFTLFNPTTIESAVTATLAANEYNLRLTGTDNINGTGNNLNNILTGNSGNNTLSGRTGNDTLDGGLGADMLSGGEGNDTYYVDNVGDDVINEQVTGGTDTILSSVYYSLYNRYVENLTLIGTGHVNAAGNNLNNILTGNSGNNTLYGGTGNDTLDGGLGADILNGGEGNDSYYVDDVGDSIINESATGGLDAVFSSVTYTLASYVENLTLIGTDNTKATGNNLNNVLMGNSGNNTLSGGTGSDTLDGGLGADILSGGEGNDLYYVENIGDDVINESVTGGTDTILSSVSYSLNNRYVENLTLIGTGHVNAAGNNLNNVLMGNSGNNTLYGGTGNDTYVFGIGGGQDLITEISGTADVLSILSGVAEEQLWFSKVGNHLEVSIIGTTDKVTVNNWYVNGTANQLEQIRTATGDVLASSQVQNLVTVMSSFSPPPVGTTTLDSGTYASVLSVIAANWS